MLFAIYFLIPLIEIIPLPVIGATVIFSLFRNLNYKLPFLLWKHFKYDFILYICSFAGMICFTATIGSFFIIIGSSIIIYKIGSKDSYEAQNFKFFVNYSSILENQSKSDSIFKVLQSRNFIY